MTRLYLYAIVPAAEADDTRWGGMGGAAGAPHVLGTGLAGEPLSLVTVGDLAAVVGAMEDSPDATPDAMRGHDAVVRRLVAFAEAILPARFGTVQDAPALSDWLAAAVGLEEALHLVAGREQMTLHVFQDDTPIASEVDTDSAGEAGLGPGARYLAERQRHWRHKEQIPELEPLRPRLDALVAAERVEFRATPPWRASVYHLIERGRSAEYREAVEANLDLVAGVRLRVSGPWAPYAFAPAATLQ